MAKAILYRWCYHPDGRRMKDVGILSDGTLRNPHGYPEADVREAIAAAQEREREQRRAAAKKAAETRARRRETNLYRIVEKIIANNFQPGPRCALCGRALKDPESRARGIGPECHGDIQALVDLRLMIQKANREAGQ